MPLNPATFKNLFISEETIKSNSFIDGNIDPKLVLPSIKTAQDLKLKPLLGTALFTDLQTKIEGDSLNEDEKALVETYIANTLTWYTIAELYIFSTFRLKNKGAGRQNDIDENFVVVDLQEAKELAEASRNRAEQYGEEMIKFIRANKDKFPAYADCVESCSPDLPGKKTAYTCPIFLG